MNIQMDKDLYFTTAEISLLLDKVPHDCTDVELFTKGKRGVIFKASYHDKPVAIKIPHPDSDAPSTPELEARYLEKANAVGVGPKLYVSSDDYVVMEFVDGILIGEFLKNDSIESEKIIQVIKLIFDQLISLDKIGINKFELTNPYKHIIVKNDFDPVLIDFERARHTTRPKNVTQFAEYLTSRNILPLLQERDLLLEVAKFKSEISNYLSTGILNLDTVL